jgi:2-polyprenyl-3-methyl-5-hydroxy-6-metoxy-1,4-benzoquinol methylase
MFDYEKETLTAYQNDSRAKEYKEYHTKKWSWGRFATWKEQRILDREISKYKWSSKDRLLDIPCGTGVLGRLLHKFPFKIVASDISKEMIELAKAEYPSSQLEDCVVSNITNTGFAKESFSSVVVLGFLHRVPDEIKVAAIKEISGLSSKLVIMTCSVDSTLNRFKHKIISVLNPALKPAPCPTTVKQIVEECERNNLRLVRKISVIPVISAHTLFIFEKIK